MAAVHPHTVPMEALDGPRGLPIIGSLLDIDFKAFHRHLEKWCDEYGSIYRFRIGPRKIVVVAEPETIKRMFRERPDGFRRTRSLEAATIEMRLNGVFSAEGDNWRRQRKIVALALNSAHLKPLFPKLLTTTERLMRRWEAAAEAGTPVDLCRDLMRLTVDVTTQLAFGIDVNTVETDGPVIQQNLDKIFPMLNWRINAPFRYWRYLRMPKDRELDRALDDVQKQVDHMIAEVRARMAADASLYDHPTNFLEAIIAAQKAEGLEFSDADIFGNVCTLLLAGEDTTANTIAWAANYFIEYPEHFATARAEVDGVIGSDALPREIEQTAHLPFIEAFYNETMRLKPVAPLNAMEPLQDIELMGYHIPKGTVIMLLTRHIAVNEAQFGHAGTFDPDRWLTIDEERQCPHDTSAFIPFGTGPRFCPGRNLALLEIKTVLWMLCRNFDIELADRSRQVGEKYAFTMMPSNLIVQFRRRAETGVS